MNILFLLRTLDIGGVEVVTATLANKFLVEKHGVSVFVFEEGTGKVKDRFAPGIPVVVGLGYKVTEENVELLRRLLLENRVDVVINQWGLPLIPIKVLTKAKKGLCVKVISVYHNDPLQNGRIQSVASEIASTGSFIRKAMLRMKKMIYRYVTGYAMRYVYSHSDRYEVLSPSFVEHFRQFTKLRNTNRLVVQTNPVSLENDGFVYNSTFKKKEIVYVGRLDYTQKRVHRIIEIWAQLESQLPDWRLTIVGDGDERENMERMVKELELSRVSFEGFQQPRPYYERASLLILTSEFEGFPLVLAECMSFGVVPVVYGSYSAVYDIIQNGKDGVIVPQMIDGFNATVMAEEMKYILLDDKRLSKMTLAAIDKSKNYSIDKIYGQWMSVISAMD